MKRPLILVGVVVLTLAALTVIARQSDSGCPETGHRQAINTLASLPNSLVKPCP
jgi:hypothetical protein